jgi:tetratricopeptide (TPR) repeat protein
MRRSILRAMTFVLALALMLGVTAAPAQVESREEAIRALSDARPQARRAGVSQLGDVGKMADVTLLLKSLRDQDTETRELAERSIWEIWSRSGNAEVDALYRIGVAQMAAGDLEQSITTFTRVIRQKPDFAEGWNKRATLYFLAGDLRKSLADCEEVMKRNPYHFGALSGYAQIYVRLERYERALEYSRRALEINPNLDGVRRNMEVIEHLIEQRRRQSV